MFCSTKFVKISVIFVYGFSFWFRVSYRDGVMEHEPKACAAVKGTQIMVTLSVQFLKFWYQFGYINSWRSEFD